MWLPFGMLPLRHFNDIDADTTAASIGLPVRWRVRRRFNALCASHVTLHSVPGTTYPSRQPARTGG
jgi:hypothetical protein